MYVVYDFCFVLYMYDCSSFVWLSSDSSNQSFCFHLFRYPKDSDKIMLARQTGLTRSQVNYHTTNTRNGTCLKLCPTIETDGKYNGQVSNWFINARVRLWKPMVEEMYKEEAGDAEMESNSSSEVAPKNTKDDMNHSSTAASAFESKSSNQPHDVEMVGTSNDSDFQNRDDHDQQLMAAAYQMQTRFGSRVSLTLGLQHSEDGSLPPIASLGSHHQNFVAMRDGGGGEGAGGSSVGPETVSFDCVDSSDRQQRFGSSHLLHDFVA